MNLEGPDGEWPPGLEGLDVQGPSEGFQVQNKTLGLPLKTWWWPREVSPRAGQCGGGGTVAWARA